MCLLIFFALRSAHNFNFKKALIISLILTVLYAFSDEAHQYFVPERQARLFDVGVDSLGTLFSSMAIILFRRVKIRDFIIKK